MSEVYLQDAILVLDEVLQIPGIASHMCLAGGIVPYLNSGKTSYRVHSNVDVLVDSDYMNFIREYFELQQKAIFDSMEYSDTDYGFSTYYGNVMVSFEAMDRFEQGFVRKSYDPIKHRFCRESFPQVDYRDIMTTVSYHDMPLTTYSLEFLKAQKEKFYRPKDRQDIAVLNQMPMEMSKYQRCVIIDQQADLSVFPCVEKEYQKKK